MCTICTFHPVSLRDSENGHLSLKKPQKENVVLKKPLCFSQLWYGAVCTFLTMCPFFNGVGMAMCTFLTIPTNFLKEDNKAKS